jgi:aspartyl-tRNA(Asn)/glutamyl-tRNA(Gln) amidotransferase subunit A
MRPTLTEDRGNEMSTTSQALHTLTLVELSTFIANHEITPMDLVEASLAQIDRYESEIQAWCYLDRETVLRQAADLTRSAQAGQFLGPLHGIPIGIKDEFHVAGMPTYMAASDDPPRPVDATAVAKLRAAGAIIMGKTHMPIDGVMPPTRNPWNFEHSAGGTSSGSGAAVGARMVPAALGEQTAGSNLRPAAFCGVDALKPTYGRIGRFGMYPFAWSHDHVGIIGLTMHDIALVFSLLSGPDQHDPTSRSEPAPPADLKLDSLPRPRIGRVRNFFPERTQGIMLEAIDQSAMRLKDAGATIVDVTLPDDFDMVWMVHRLVGNAEGLTFRSRKMADSGCGPETGRDIAASLVPASYYLQAQRIRQHLWNSAHMAFADVDALLMAVAPAPAPRGTSSTGEATLLIPWSCLGYPAITVNGGLSADGLPLGLQLVAPSMADYDLMRVGAWCEEALGRLPVPPPVRGN